VHKTAAAFARRGREELRGVCRANARNLGLNTTARICASWDADGIACAATPHGHPRAFAHWLLERLPAASKEEADRNDPIIPKER